MTGGYMGKVLLVDLSKGELKDEVLDEKLCRDYIQKCQVRFCLNGDTAKEANNGYFYYQ